MQLVYCPVDDTLFEVSPEIRCSAIKSLYCCYGNHAAGLSLFKNFYHIRCHSFSPPTISSLKITDRSFSYASPRLGNQLPDSFHQPHHCRLDSPPHQRTLNEDCRQAEEPKQLADEASRFHLGRQRQHSAVICSGALLFSSRVLCPSLVTLCSHKSGRCTVELCRCTCGER